MLSMTKDKFYALWCIILSLGLDQVSKWFLLEYMHSIEHKAIEITPFFNVVLVWNTGVSFGLLANHNAPLILTLISAIIVFILLIWITKNNNRSIASALGLVVGGAAGNVIDRLRFGAVTDFLDFHINTYHWPAFNIADSCIFIGVVLLSISGMFTDNTKTP